MFVARCNSEQAPGPGATGKIQPYDYLGEQFRASDERDGRPPYVNLCKDAPSLNT